MASSAVAFVELPYLRRRALGIVTIPSVSVVLAVGGYAFAAHASATTGCYPALLDAPLY